MSSESNPFNEDSDSLPTILLASHRRFLRFLEKRVGSCEDAEEILQSAFVRSLDKGDEIRERESSVAWFYRLLRNAVIDHYRRKAANQRKLEGFAQQLSEAVETADSDTERVICECIQELIPKLKSEYAELISRVDLQGNDVSSAADALGITAGNARVRLHRARAALRLEVERSCRTCASHGCLDCTCKKPERS